MKFEYTLRNGSTIGIMDMMGVHSEYEALCTGEYIQDTYTGGKMSDKIARMIGYEVRRNMDKCDYPDEEASIDYVTDIVLNNICKWLRTKANPEIASQCKESLGLEDCENIDSFTVFLTDLLDWIYGDEMVKKEFENYFENEAYICAR